MMKGDDVKFRRIKDLREDGDLTQQYLANQLQISRSAYSNYESGKREIPIEILWRLADFYGTTIDYLVGRSDQGAAKTPRKKS